MRVEKEQPLPAIVDMEAALLSSILLDPMALLAAKDLKPADFSRSAHAALFATMRQLQEDGLPTDLGTLVTRLERTGQLERVGGQPYLTRLVNAAPASSHIPAYVELLQKAASERKMTEGTPNLIAMSRLSADPQVARAPVVEPLSIPHTTNLPPGDKPSAAVPAGKNGEQARHSAGVLTGKGGERAPAALFAAQQPPKATLVALSPAEAQEQLTTLAPALTGLLDLLDADFPEPDWIVPDLLPEGLTLLAAKPKLGKSWMALDLAWAVAAGGIALRKFPVEQGPVLYLALEDSPKRLSTRAWKLLQGTPPAALDLATRWPRLDEGGLSLIELWLQAHPNARLVIIDTLAKIRGHSKGNTLYGEDYASLEEVQLLAHKYGIAILVIHHTGKESREDPLDEVNATQGLTGVADNILVLRRERGKAEAVLVGDGRELSGVELALHFDNDLCRWGITGSAEEVLKTPERTEVLRILKASPEPMSPTQIAQLLDKTPVAIRKLLWTMAHDGAVINTKYGKYSLPMRPGNSGNTGNAGDIQDNQTSPQAARTSTTPQKKRYQSRNNSNAEVDPSKMVRKKERNLSALQTDRAQQLLPPQE